MFVIAGLGNPGSKYAHTRHNVGFDVVEVFSQKYDIPIRKLRCKAEVGEGTLFGEKVVLARPQTFMNLSGESIVALRSWYKPEDDHLLIVYDDVDLPAGKLRFRTSGSAGTHNGMRNILQLTGADDFPRVRVGIGRPPQNRDLKDWVLTGFATPEERETMFKAYMNAAEILAEYVRGGAEAARRHLSALAAPNPSRQV